LKLPPALSDTRPTFNVRHIACCFFGNCHFASVVNKDLTFKAKDLAFKAKAKAKDLAFKAKLKN